MRDGARRRARCCTRLSSRATEPRLPGRAARTGARSTCADRCGRPRVQAQLHVVVLVDRLVAEARDLLVAADHQPQRGGDVVRCRRRGRRRARGRCRRAARACRARSVVSASTMPPSSSARSRSVVGVVGQLLRARARGSTKSISKLPPPMLNDGTLRTDARRSRILCAASRASACITSRWRVVAAERRAAARRCMSSRQNRREREHALFVRRDAHVDARPGSRRRGSRRRRCDSTTAHARGSCAGPARSACITSSIAARLAPCGAVHVDLELAPRRRRWACTPACTSR